MNDHAARALKQWLDDHGGIRGHVRQAGVRLSKAFDMQVARVSLRGNARK